MSAEAGGRARSLVVSLHDVAPPFLGECREFRRRLASAGVARAALLVVPRWHLRAARRDDEAFWGWLGERAAAGDEVVLHGLTHRAARLPRDPVGRWVATRYTAGEGEFYRLGYLEARDRLRQGLELLGRRGFRPRGFVAPAWLLSPPARQAAADLGLDYTVRWRAVEALRRGARLTAPTLVWSVRTGVRRQVSWIWCRLWERLNATAPLLRVAAHPPDMRDERLSAEICRLVEGLARRRAVTTYGSVAVGSAF